MSSAWSYLLLCAAPATAFYVCERGLAWASQHSTIPRDPAPESSRADLAAQVRRLRAEYADLAEHNPAAKAHKLRAARLALADAEKAYAARR